MVLMQEQQWTYLRDTGLNDDAVSPCVCSIHESSLIRLGTTPNCVMLQTFLQTTTQCILSNAPITSPTRSWNKNAYPTFDKEKDMFVLLVCLSSKLSCGQVFFMQGVVLAGSSVYKFTVAAIVKMEEREKLHFVDGH